MSGVISKFVQESGDKMGLSPLTVSRSLYSALIFGYFFKVGFPTLLKKLHGTKVKEEEDEAVQASHIVVKDAPAKQGPAINKVKHSK